MQTSPINTPFFSFDGRGPSIIHWIKDDESYLPGTHFKQRPSGFLAGVNYTFGNTSPKGLWVTQKAWVFFWGLQVIQITSQEVHSYWHLDFTPQRNKSKPTGVWEITESDWLRAFAQTHLPNHKHFILEFYDELVEVICSDLIFGTGDFDIQKAVNLDTRFAAAYFSRADSNREIGPIDQVIADYELYLAKEPGGQMADYARKVLASLRNQPQ